MADDDFEEEKPKEEEPEINEKLVDDDNEYEEDLDTGGNFVQEESAEAWDDS